jgi:hypothetical protein
VAVLEYKRSTKESVTEYKRSTKDSARVQEEHRVAALEDKWSIGCK